jgi:hypothetical protein
LCWANGLSVTYGLVVTDFLAFTTRKTGELIDTVAFLVLTDRRSRTDRDALSTIAAGVLIDADPFAEPGREAVYQSIDRPNRAEKIAVGSAAASKYSKQ